MYNLDETLLEKFNDDIELLQFGFAWLKAMFFQIDPSGLFQVDNDKAEERLKK
jgi:hypothetical protein